ncbi:amino acid adenylation domain-containing protein [Paenibacillus sp. FSL L8-0435]|uniref:non-ribosomal peptide synthetase/type I polyketide synthase n=1 Tax=Paenibacillus sp. FSL L8-0435 TaxID=2954618 RepID=UPI0030DB3D98
MVQKTVELSETQKGIYFDCQVNDPTSYNISASMQFDHLQMEIFRRAIELLMYEQVVLRTRIEIKNDVPVLSVHEDMDYSLALWDLSSENQENPKEQQLEALVDECIGTPFELERGPLFRIMIVQMDKSRYILTLCIHHLICDGLSLELMKNKLIQSYTCLLEDQPVDVKLDEGFISYVEAENKKLHENKYSKEREYWLNKMKGAEPLSLKHDFPAGSVQEGIGHELRFDISESLMADITQMSKDNEVTVFMFFMGAFGILMSKYVGTDDITFASPYSHRPGMDLEETIGCFVHMLPMRFHIDLESTLKPLLQQVATTWMDTYRNIGYPNNLIVRDSMLQAQPGSPSLFDISFVYDSYEEDMLGTRILDQDKVTFPGDLMVVLSRLPQGAQLKLQYKPSLFREDSMERMGQRFLYLLNQLVTNSDQKIREFSLLMQDEKENLLYRFNQTSYFPYTPQHIMDIFHDKVARFPERVALMEGKQHQTYAQVNAKANQLARQIVAIKKSDNAAVGVQMPRSSDMVIALLAVLKAGCAFVPVDPSYPLSRKAYILSDADISIVLAMQPEKDDETLDVQYIYVEGDQAYTGDVSNLEEALNPHSLAYIMYTSGSTGKPKGVMVENHSVVNTLLDLERRFPMQAQDVYLLKTAYTFDVSATELFGWFMGEGALSILEPGAEKDPARIVSTVASHKVTHINFVPTLFRLFLETMELRSDLSALETLKWMFVGGEAVTPDIIEKFNRLGIGASLENVYGPTECTIWVSHYPLSHYEGLGNVPIGYPLNESRWYVVGNHDELQPLGIPGELCLSGVGLARGYLNLEQMTREKFVPNPFFQEGQDAEHFRYMYRTGDLVRSLPSGTIEYLGRIDFQVKIQGARLETGEIENTLSSYPGVIQTVVVMKSFEGRSGLLYAYYLSEQELPSVELREHLSRLLPAYMIPSVFVHKSEFPLNSSGKIDRKALMADITHAHASSTFYTAPSSELEKVIAEVWAEVLGVERVGRDDHFFELGGNSFSVIQAHNKLKHYTDVEFPVPRFFECPTLRQFAALGPKDEGVRIPTEREQLFQRKDGIMREDIAIVGIAVNVPGAEDIREFWSNLVERRESIHFYSDDELRELGVEEALLRSPRYVKAKGRANGIDEFDAGFFDYTPGEAKMMSPQFRLLYQGIWEALEDAGCRPDEAGKVGVFLGGSDDFEWYRQVLFNDANYSSKYEAFTLSTNHFLATRMAYKLNLKGPAYTALTGCSTSLVTPHLACQSLIVGECDVAVAGGITVELPNEGGYIFEDGMMFSTDGHCRPFDAAASGTVFSNGMGIVVLKRVTDALRDEDHIYGVIKGSAINNDGQEKLSFLAPSVSGQAEVIQDAYKVAGVDPETVSYIEAHGTGTLLGDPIEVNSLTRAFASDQKQFCYLGSVKGNVGHMDTAAGVVGLIKVALSLGQGYIPGTANYEQPNPKIDFLNTPFKVNAQGVDWKQGKVGVMRAGINSFGVGGTNAHMVLEEAPEMEKCSPDDDVNIFLFSAKTEYSLNRTAERIMEHLTQQPDQSVSNAAWTLQSGRSVFAYRKALILDKTWKDNPDKLIQQLGKARVYHSAQGTRPVYFMFPGQGSQYQGMGAELYRSTEQTGLAPIFRSYIQEILDLLPAEEREDMLSVVYGDQHPERINQTEYSQFALFMTSYALAKSLLDLGIKPDGMIGHSIGELAAAAVAGVFELGDAVNLVRLRGRLMQQQQPGVMLAIMADAQQVKSQLEEDMWLALVNTTGSSVIGGTAEAISRMEAKAEGLGWKCIRVKTSHAFHTPMMNQAAEEFRRYLAEHSLHTPQIPLLSNTSGTWALGDEITQPDYWSRHILQPVLFESNLAEVLKDERAVLIEVGAGRTLSSFARQHSLSRDSQTVLNMLRHVRETEQDSIYVNRRLAELWCEGIEPDWKVFKGQTVRRKCSLPTYVFNKQSYPVSVSLSGSSAAAGMDTGDDRQHADQGKGSGSTLIKGTVYTGGSDQLKQIVLDAYRTIFGIDDLDEEVNFFAVGGDSLKAVSLSAWIRSHLGIQPEVADVFNHSTPIQLAEHLYVMAKPKVDQQTIQSAPTMDAYPISSAQMRMFTQAMLDPGNTAYNLPSATIIEGELDRIRVEAALQKLMQHHEALRTSFEIRGGQIVQIIQPSVRLSMGYAELHVADDQELPAMIETLIRPFDLGSAPLMRVELIKIGERKHLLFFDIHHIIADGTSVEIITRDFNDLYFGKEHAVRLQYKDYAVWQQQRLASNDYNSHQTYWLDHLGPSLPVLQLPLDHERPSQRSMQGGRLHFTLNRSLTQHLHQLASSSEASMYMVMLSVWNLLLAHRSGQQDIVVGTPVAGRMQEEWKETVGMFVNMIAMRNFPTFDRTYTDFLRELKQHTLDAFAYQEYPFNELVAQLGVARELNRSPVFDVCFDYQNMDLHGLELHGLQFSSFPVETGTSTYDLLLTCQENREKQVIEGYIEYSLDLFRRDTVEGMMQEFIGLCQEVVQQPNLSVSELFERNERSHEHPVHRLAGPRLDYTPAVGLHRLFELQAEHTPDKKALLVSSGASFTYRELNEKANTLAWKLIDQGVRRDEPVGILSRRDESLIIMLLAVLKAGAAYVPLDPAFPPQRIVNMIEDSRMNVLLCTPDAEGTVTFSGERFVYDSTSQDVRASVNPDRSFLSSDLSCVIFTSGSTGRPKGVMITHEAMVNFVEDIRHRHIFAHETDRIISVTTISFDIFGFEVWTPLCTGYSLYLANEQEQLDPALASRRIREHGVTHILSTVSRIKAFVENPEFAQALGNLRCVLTGGENVPVGLLTDLKRLTPARVFNMYGPTETTIWSTTKELNDTAAITIGKPITNTEIYILNDEGEILPPGSYGELCIAGKGLSRGYLHNAAETNARFIANSNVLGGRLYRTGDLARILPDGDVELMGRLDQQVKIRGYRIELNEIEQAAMNYERVREAVVKVEGAEPHSLQLILFYSLKPGIGPFVMEQEDVQLRTWLKQRLPQYMMPSRLIRLENLPVLPNGKLNRNALRLADFETGERDNPALVYGSSIQGIERAKVDLEQMLIAAWKEILNLDTVNIHDHFFDIGGNSLGLILINNRLNAYLDKSVPLVQLFEHSSIASLVNHLVAEQMLPTVTQQVQEGSGHIASVGYPVTNPEPTTAPKEYVMSTVEHSKVEQSRPEQSIQFASEHSSGIPSSSDIAVIGMAGHFPGSRNIEEFWDNLMAGKDGITRLDEDDLTAAGVRPEDFKHPDYVRAKGVLQDTEYFDSGFFEYPHQESNMMDPQIRLLHQCSWEALEHAGCDPYSYEGAIGLFAGSGLSLPWMVQFLGRSGNLLQAFEAMTLNEKDYITTRVSHKLNLRGPSMAVQTACSTSLVAIHQAAESLIRGECDVALAGGVSISYPLKEGYHWHEGMIYSKDGHCRPFDEQASGTVSGNGCGMVVLKSLRDAQRDGDHIYAVIKGSAINNDGMDKIGYTAPSVAGQVKVIQSALHRSGVSPKEISYLEAHGTGTKLGDPIEIEALRQSWGTDRRNYCALGSVKANIGHLDAAAGVAGFIKTVLTLYHRVVPPQIHMNRTNPMLELEHSPFYINKEPQPLEEAKGILRAGVSSFGIGGTNAHVILEQPPVQESQANYESLLLLPFSAKSESALERTYDSVLQAIHALPEQLPNAAWTLQKGRSRFIHRKALIVVDGYIPPSEQSIEFETQASVMNGKPKVMFYLSGNASWEARKIRELYASVYRSQVSEIFKQHFEEILNLFESKEQYAIRQGIGRSLTDSRLERMQCFVVQYALYQTVMQLGIKPDAVCGQGVGELVGLVISDALDPVHAVGLLYNWEHWSLEEGALSDAMTGRMTDATVTDLASSIAPLLSPNFLFTLLNRKTLSESAGHTLWIVSNQQQDTDQIVPASFSEPNVIALTGDRQSLLEADVYLMKLLAFCWCSGMELDWEQLNGTGRKQKISLPTYSFDPIVHQHDVALYQLAGMSQVAAGSITALDQSPAGKVRVQRTDDEIRHILSQLWQELLGNGAVSLEDDFFELGGHSLKAISLASRIKEMFGLNLGLEEVFDHSVFEHMVQWIAEHQATSDSDSVNPILPVTKKEKYKTTSAQRRMYVVHEWMKGESTAYNLASSYMVRGKLDPAQFRVIMDALVERHEAFRTRFEMIDGELFQVVEDQVPSVVELLELETAGLEQVMEWIKPFDLTCAPLVRVKLIRLSQEEHILFIDMHHIISDQSSIAILMQDFARMYRGETLQSLDIQYKDYAEWRDEAASHGQSVEDAEFWIREFKDMPAPVELLTDFPRHGASSYSGDRRSIELGESLSTQVNDFCTQQGLTPYMLFMATLNLLIWKYTGQDDLVVGTAVAGREKPELNNVMGMFVNMLAIRTSMDRECSTEAYLNEMRGKLLSCYEHQQYPYEALVEQLGLFGDLSRNPLFDVVLNYINMGTDDPEAGELMLEPWVEGKVDAKFDLTWTLVEHKQCYTVELDYRSDLFKAESMELMLDKFRYILSQITTGDNERIGQIKLTTPEEEDWLLYGVNDNAAQYPRDATISQLFEEQVHMHPQKTALVWEDDEWSYADLYERVQWLASRLLGQGVKSGSSIALILDRGPIQMISILATLKVGCSYVPIDPASPPSRIEFILQDCDAAVLLTETAYVSTWQSVVPCIVPADELAAFDSGNMQEPVEDMNMTALDPAYIIYTSGSTGTPKGTVMSHRNVTKVMKNSNFVTVVPEDRILQISNYAFDGSIFDIFASLINGATLVLISKETILDMARLADVIQQQRISVFYIPTSLFNMLVDWDADCLKNVRRVMFGGEAASVSHANKALACVGPGRLLNGYGPTEATFFASYHLLQQTEPYTGSLPIGYPLSNTALYVLDDELKPVPPNVPGELYISGDAVGIGYLNREDLTRKHFLDDPFRKGERMYRTGDIVKRMIDGSLIFIERSDFQVKIRGFRIELSEIGNCMERLSGVRDAFVMTVTEPSGSLYIAAFYTSNTGADVEYIRRELHQQLPEYMVPARIIRMDHLPINANGKVDRRALSEHLVEEQQRSLEVSSPLTKTERVILAAMRQILGNPGIGVEDHFFQNGGHSLKAIAFTQILTKEGIAINVNELFQYPTVRGLAKLVDINPPASVGSQDSLHIQSPIVIPQDITLHEKQLDSLVLHVINSCNQVSSFMAGMTPMGRFPLSPIQQAHASTTSRASGFTTTLEGELNEQAVKHLILGVISRHQLLHSIIYEEEQLYWHPCDMSLAADMLQQLIPYLDIRHYASATIEQLEYKLVQSLLHKTYTLKELPWRLCILRTGATEHKLIWSFDHLAFDGMSAQIIKQQLESKALYRPQGTEIESDLLYQVRNYEDYVNFLSQGPIGVSEDEMKKQFSLQAWNTCNTIVMNKLKETETLSPSAMAVELSLAGKEPAEVWWTCFETFANIIAAYLNISQLPIALVHYGREYGEESYYDYVGEFLDLIPVLVDSEFTQEDLLERLEFTKRHSINFMALTHDSSLSAQYGGIQEQLGTAYRQAEQEPRQMILFNYQGFISSSEAIPMSSQSSDDQDSNSGLAQFEWVIRYDEECLYVHLSCQTGLDIKRMKQLIDDRLGSDVKVVVHNEAMEVQHVQ